MNILLQKMAQRRHYPDDMFSQVERCGHYMPSNIDAVCRRLYYHYRQGHRIVLLTDIDTDGVMSGVLGYAGLSELDFKVNLFLPSTDKYGFDRQDIDRLVSQYPDVACILTADVGIAAREGFEYANQLGIEMLVTDHHVSVGNPCGNIYVDPMCEHYDEHDPNYFSGICGAHVLYLVLYCYAQMYCNQFAQQQIYRLRVFAGIATVADMMPMLYENRYIVRDAIAIARMVYAGGDSTFTGHPYYMSAFHGLHALISAFDKNGRQRSYDDIDEGFFGFSISPAVNSVKRMGKSISEVYDVFFASPEVASAKAVALVELSQDRKSKVAEAFDVLCGPNTEQKYAPYLYFTDALGGLRGLLAQNLMAVSHMPTIVVGYPSVDGRLSGSGRSPSWFPFLKLLGDDVILGVHPAGHDEAFGISFDDEASVARFYDFMTSTVPSYMPADGISTDDADVVISTVQGDETDCPIDIEVFEDFWNECQMLKPFGTGFAEPLVKLTFRPKEADWAEVSKAHTEHLKVILDQGFSVMLFNQRSLFPDGLDVSQLADCLPDVVTVYGHLKLNSFMGRNTMQFITTLDKNLVKQK